MDRNMDKAANELRLAQMEIRDVLKELDIIKGSISSSWKGETGEVYSRKLETLSIGINDSYRSLGIINDELERYV